MSITNLLNNWSFYRQKRPYQGQYDLNRQYSEYKWAMALDLDICTGCNACTTACYAENNLPVVGKKRFNQGHVMHWIRIERYWDENMGEFPEQGASFLPMMCQQCEEAPCETVCPVGATSHTNDGLNSQNYHRCVGSRYCSVNCPYKVRYFNFWNYPSTAWPAPLPDQLNPDVTVRTKGIMEKCTFCVQRLNEAKSRARTEYRLVRDGEVVPACVQACPTSAITFGNIVDPKSKVAMMWKNQQVDLYKDMQEKDNSVRGYRILEDLRPFPSVMYLERVRDMEA